MLTIPQVLKQYKHVTVVGISANPQRPSNWIARYLLAHGFKVIGVNPGCPEIPGIEVVAKVSDVSHSLEIVNIYRSPDAIPALIEELKDFKPPVVWLQPGAQNPDAEAHARKLGMQVISGECIYEEHKALAEDFKR